MNRLNVLSGQVTAAKDLPNEFAHVPVNPPDPILSLSTGYKKDTNAKKVNLGIGAYRDDNGKPFVFPVVRKVEKAIVESKLDKEYCPIEGTAEFGLAARKVCFGDDSPLVTNGRVASCQSISGSGALNILGTFFKQFRPSAIYQSAPTWGNHAQMFGAAGLTVRSYRYYDNKTKGFNFRGMIEDLENAPAGSIILLHTCAHNPTGVDPSKEQWHAIADVIRARGHFPFFDTAYQGFASGDLQKDGYGLRYFAEQGFQMCVAQSFAKIMGLYGERTGCIHFVAKDQKTAQLILGQLKRIVRSAYSSPPIHGARIAAKIINTPEYYNEWMSDLAAVTVRMNEMRRLLRAELEKIGTKGSWDHVTNQIGMFSFTGLTTKQSTTMVEKHHVYMTKNGRISIAGLTKANIPHVAASIKDVVDNY